MMNFNKNVNSQPCRTGYLDDCSISNETNQKNQSWTLNSTQHNYKQKYKDLDQSTCEKAYTSEYPKLDPSKKTQTNEKSSSQT